MITSSIVNRNKFPEAIIIEVYRIYKVLEVIYNQSQDDQEKLEIKNLINYINNKFFNSTFKYIEKTKKIKKTGEDKNYYASLGKNHNSLSEQKELHEFINVQNLMQTSFNFLLGKSFNEEVIEYSLSKIIELENSDNVINQFGAEFMRAFFKYYQIDQGKSKEEDYIFVINQLEKAINKVPHGATKDKHKSEEEQAINIKKEKERTSISIENNEKRLQSITGADNEQSYQFYDEDEASILLENLKELSKLYDLSNLNALKKSLCFMLKHMIKLYYLYIFEGKITDINVSIDHLRKMMTCICDLRDNISNSDEVEKIIAKITTIIPNLDFGEKRLASIPNFVMLLKTVIATFSINYNVGLEYLRNDEYLEKEKIKQIIKNINKSIRKNTSQGNKGTSQGKSSFLSFFCCGAKEMSISARTTASSIFPQPYSKSSVLNRSI